MLNNHTLLQSSIMCVKQSANMQGDSTDIVKRYNQWHPKWVNRTSI